MPAVLFALVKGYRFAQSAPEPPETFLYRFSHRGRIVSFKQVYLDIPAFAFHYDA
jgi:hypothetical protein